MVVVWVDGLAVGLAMTGADERETPAAMAGSTRTIAPRPWPHRELEDRRTGIHMRAIV
jgi:hypothetical protein